MIKASLLRVCSSPPPPLLESNKDLQRTRLTPTMMIVSCSSMRSKSKNGADVPKLEPFSRTKFERAVKEPPLIEKSENELSDYCSTLEGDDSYSCWRAYFELKDLERELPKEEVERLILQSGGVKSLIGCLHGIAAIHKAKNNGSVLAKPFNGDKEGIRHCPIPDGIPKTLEELAEEESARMPDSPYTRLLRARGRLPAWINANEAIPFLNMYQN